MRLFLSTLLAALIVSLAVDAGRPEPLSFGDLFRGTDNA